MNCFSDNGCQSLWRRVRDGNTQYACLLDKGGAMGVTDCNKYVNSPPKEIVINVPKVKEIPVIEEFYGKSFVEDANEFMEKEQKKHRGWPKGKPRK
jgi:hypothetical protein